MSKIISFLIGFCLCWVTVVFAQDLEGFCFKKGEKLVYRVHYGFINAGTASFEVKPQRELIGGRNCFQIAGTGKTAGGWDWVFKVRDYYYAYLDEVSLDPMMFLRYVDEGGYKFDEKVMFDHQKDSVTTKKSKYKSTDGIMDIMSALYRARNMDFSNAKLGQRYPMKIFLDEQEYEVGLIYLGKETIKTELGTFRCLKLQPILIISNVFKDTDGMLMWATDDQNKIPIRIKSEILVGSIKADLESFENLKYPLSSKVK